MTISVACLQLNSGNGIAANIAKVEAMVKQAASNGAELIATPENTFLMEAPGAKRELFAQEKHPGVLAAANLAKQYKIWLLIGSVAVVADDSGKTVNRSLLFAPDGSVAAHYDKIHLFDVTLANGETYAESARFNAGSKVTLADTPIARLGMTVCYDVRFPHLYRALAKKGAEILAVPSAFTQTTGEAHWHVLLRTRAIENGAYVIAPAQTGTHPGGRKTYGHALIIDPWGKILADGGVDEGIVSAEIDLALVNEIRGRLPSLQHDRAFLE